MKYQVGDLVEDRLENVFGIIIDTRTRDREMPEYRVYWQSQHMNLKLKYWWFEFQIRKAIE